MIPLVKEHPLRTISFRYNGNKPVSEFELEAVEQYFKLHDQTLEFKQLQLKEFSNYTLYAEQLGESEPLLEQLKQEYGLVLPILDYIRGTVDLSKATGEEVMFDTSPMMKALNAFQGKYLPVYEQLNKAEELDAYYDQVFQKTEQASSDWDDKYFSPIIQNWEQMEIDIVTFDEDFDDYRGQWSEIYDLDKKLGELQDKVFNMYDALFEKWKPLHADLTQLLTELQDYDNRPDPGLN